MGRLPIPPSFSRLIFVPNAGPLVYVTVGGQGILVLNTHKVAGDLLDRRGNIYSDRPRMISKFGYSGGPWSHLIAI